MTDQTTTNLAYLKNLHPVKVVSHSGDRQSGKLEDGRTVRREKKLWIGKNYGMVKCADYSSHFLYHDPDFNQNTGDWPTDKQGRPIKKFVGRFTPMCSCGSFAVIVGANVYGGDASPTNKSDSSVAGTMVVCWHHSTYGAHTDGSHD